MTSSVSSRVDQKQQPRLALTYRQTAEALSLCERTVWMLVQKGQLKAVRAGRAVRIPIAEIERFLSESK